MEGWPADRHSVLRAAPGSAAILPIDWRPNSAAILGAADHHRGVIRQPRRTMRFRRASVASRVGGFLGGADWGRGKDAMIMRDFAGAQRPSLGLEGVRLAPCAGLISTAGAAWVRRANGNEVHSGLRVGADIVQPNPARALQGQRFSSSLLHAGSTARAKQPPRSCCRAGWLLRRVARPVPVHRVRVLRPQSAACPLRLRLCAFQSFDPLRPRGRCGYYSWIRTPSERSRPVGWAPPPQRTAYLSEHAPPRNRLSGVKNLRLRSGNGVHELSGQRGYAAQNAAGS